jgi:hypothetical protein
MNERLLARRGSRSADGCDRRRCHGDSGEETTERHPSMMAQRRGG